MLLVVGNNLIQFHSLFIKISVVADTQSLSHIRRNNMIKGIWQVRFIAGMVSHAPQTNVWRLIKLLLQRRPAVVALL